MLLAKKIELMKGFFFLLGVLIIGGLDGSRIKEMQYIAGIFLGLLVVFLATTILTDVIKRINKFSEEIKKEYDVQIKKSISKEENEKDLNERIQIINEREILYQKASLSSSEELYNSFKYAFITLILSIGTSLLPIFQIGTIQNHHIICILIVVGIYYTCKIIFIFLEILKVGSRLSE